MPNNFGEDLRQLDVVTFEIEDINDIGIDAPAVMMDDAGGELAAASSSSSCSCSSCCSCSTSSCCSTSTSTSSCG